MYKFLYSFLLLSFLSIKIFGQDSLRQPLFTIVDIEIEGNKKTKEQVVFRELKFKESEQYTLEYLLSVQEESEERLKNIGVFNDAELAYGIDSINYEVTAFVDVVENWYIFPGLIIELADRNFSEWWTNQNRDLSRINYGVRLEHINLTGRRDKMIVQLQSGFRKKYEIIYNLPYLNQEGTWGAEAFVFFATQDELAYLTSNNRSIFSKTNDRNTIYRRFRTGSALFYRPTIYNNHAFRLEYHREQVENKVIEDFNPDYFLDGNSIKYFMFNYQFIQDKRVAQFYPIRGYLWFVSLRKDGFKIFDEYNNASVTAGGEYFQPLSEKLVLGTKLKFKLNIDRSVVSYANNQALGYRDDVLGGYYLYVVDGTDYVYGKNNLRYKLIDKKFNLGKYMFLDQFRVLSVQLYGRLFFDYGYVNDRTYRDLYDNTFNNRWLYGWGPAVDIVLYNNYKASFNLGINHLGERHYFFEYRTNF